MAPLKLFLSILLLFSASNATQPPRTLHIPVVHRDAVFPPPPDAKRSSLHLLRRRLAADAAWYTAPTPLSSTAHGHLHSPVISGPPFGSGEYFALVGVGTPSTSALLVIDTGSDLIWLQCKPCRRCYDQVSPLYDPRGSNTYRQIPCSSPQCHMLKYPGCDGRAGVCSYVIAYGDGSASTGDLATDSLLLSDDTYIHNVTLGCGHDNEGPFDLATGLLGVGRGSFSFPTQVAAAYGHFFAYCLGDHTPREGSGSYLVFGRTPELPSTAFTPMVSNPRRPSLYYVNMAGFSVGGSRVAGFSHASLALDPATGRGGVLVDSGTAVSRLAGDAYAALRDSFDARAAADGMRKVASDGEAASVFDACYDLGRSEKAKVPRVVLHFAGGADMALPPENYLVPVEGGKGRTYYCLGFEAAEDGLSVLGNVQQRGFRVVFDVEKERVGFAPNGCSIGLNN